jgi:pyrimidine-specific ribonucleoside hydrolase
MRGVLKSLLLPRELYADDVAGIVGNCVKRYGEAEWRAVVLTNEIHGHLGIYSTLGAKMGIRARELFAENGDISVLSFAGSIPPVSCLNDGLQVSLGSSMGHGLFAVSADGNTSARARFTCGDRTLELSLKPEFEEIIKADIREGVARFGHAPAYWDYVRRLAIRYWAEWDRARIFTVNG